MFERATTNYDVVIAGSGVAAAATAIRLLAFGFRPLLLRRQRQTYRGTEAIPQAALRLFHALDADAVLKQAGAIPVRGLENRWNDSRALMKPDWFIHVDRTELAKAMLDEAVKRGAAIISIESLPQLQFEPVGREISVEGGRQKYLAAVDATGRSAFWSRPIQRFGTQVADMFHIIPFENSPLCARVIRLRDQWAYRIDLPDSIVVGVIKQKKDAAREIQDVVMKGLNIPDGRITYLGRRPAFPQWSTEPVWHRKISVGDAAFAHDPIAGQGVCFALGSGLAASAVIRTWRDSPENSVWADEYFRNFWFTERRRHSSALAALYESEPRLQYQQGVFADGQTQKQISLEETISEDQSELPSRVRFSGEVRTAAIQSNGLISPAQVIILSSGNSVRWLGDFDLLSLADFDSVAEPTAEVICYLNQVGLSREKAVGLVKWCLSNGVLAAIADDGSP